MSGIRCPTCRCVVGKNKSEYHDNMHHLSSQCINALQRENTHLRYLLAEAVGKLSEAPNTNNYEWERWRVDFVIENNSYIVK